MGGSGSETTTAARRGLEGEREAGARARARVRRCWHVVGPGSHVRVVLLSQIGVRERACRCCKEGNSEGDAATGSSPRRKVNGDSDGVSS